MEVASPGVPNGLAAPTQAPLVDPNVVVQYLSEVLQVTLGASKEDLESTGSLLSKAKYSETVQRCTRFASDSQTALYVQKDLVSAEEPNGTEDEDRKCLHRAVMLNMAKLSANCSQHRQLGIPIPSLQKSSFLPRQLPR